MATIDVEIGGRKYPMSCRDGEEDSLREAAALVDARATDAASMLGQLSEARLLLFTALMLADDLKEQAREPSAAADPAPQGVDAAALDRIADRLEALADRLAPEA